MNKIARIILIFGFFAGGLAVISGAFGAHLLNGFLRANGYLETYKTAVLYQYIHSILLIATGILYQLFPRRLLFFTSIIIIAGLILFCGSLYAIALSGIAVIGFITPFGGLCFILAWLLLAWSFIRKN